MSRSITHLAFAVLISFATVALAQENAQQQDTTAAASPAVETRLALRDLWSEHIVWVRNYVLGTHVKDQAMAQAAETEIVANANGIAAAIEPFYGQEARDALFELLAGHWTAIKHYNDATQANNSSDAQNAVTELTENAKQISQFLSEANPNWPEDTLVSLLSTHGAHHVAQIDQIKAKDYEAEAKTWHEMRSHMNTIADALTDGLVKQFPDKF